MPTEPTSQELPARAQMISAIQSTVHFSSQNAPSDAVLSFAADQHHIRRRKRRERDPLNYTRDKTAINERKRRGYTRDKPNRRERDRTNYTHNKTAINDRKRRTHSR
ncbi:unnamed protein product, partial [Ectocarpus sp. 12 AP-2014]